MITNRPGRVVAALLITVVNCSPDERPIPTRRGASERELVVKGAAVVIAVGDIAVCGISGDEATARLADSLMRADSVRGTQTAVITMGDNAYPSGDQGIKDYFPRCFGPSWGRPRIMNAIRPAPGNHDYDSGSGAPYFNFFGARAGPSGRGYYSFDISGWHMVSLNSELYFRAGTATEAKAQEEWLRADLRGHPTACALAYFHRPYFSSGIHGATSELATLWQILYDGGVDLVLNAHEHSYERFLPQTAAGVLDSTKGMEQIIAGTGGAGLRGFRARGAAGSAAQIQGRLGVAKLTLGEGQYRRAFIDTEGTVWDAGGRNCR